jgi:mycofactocin precursor peptide peptidase
MTVELGTLTWTSLGESRPIVIVPVGSCEQHGPHLPMSTDTMIAERLCGLVDDVVVAPSLTIAASGEHAGFPGTLSIGNEALTRVLIEIGRSADWSGGVIFVNGHGGNVRAVTLAVSALHAESRRAAAWSPRLNGDAHAGRTETSIMLAIAPHFVDVHRATAGNIAPLGEIMTDIRAGGIRSVSENGVLGDPHGASREEGERLLAQMADDLRSFVGARRREWQ